MKTVRFSIFVGLMLFICACTPQTPATPLATNTAIPSATATATPNPSPTPTPIPTLFGGYAVDKLEISWTDHSDFHFTSLDNKTSFDVKVAGKTYNNYDIHGPYWSPDGKWVIFAYSDECVDSCGIHLLDVANRTDHLININQPYFSTYYISILFSWNPQNDKIITTIPQSSTISQDEKRKIITISTKDFSVADTGILGFQPTFSPVSNDFAFMDCAWPSIKYYFVKEGSQEPTLITSVKWGNPFTCNPTPILWSRDGKRIFFTTPHELQSVNIDGSDLHVILHTNQNVDFIPNALSPDGNYMIVNIGNPNTDWHFGYVDLRNDKLTMMEKGTGLFWDRSGDSIWVKTTEGKNLSYFLIDLQTGALTPVDFPEIDLGDLQP